MFACLCGSFKSKPEVNYRDGQPSPEDKEIMLHVFIEKDFVQGVHPDTKVTFRGVCYTLLNASEMKGQTQRVNELARNELFGAIVFDQDKKEVKKLILAEKWARRIRDQKVTEVLLKDGDQHTLLYDNITVSHFPPNEYKEIVKDHLEHLK